METEMQSNSDCDSNSFEATDFFEGVEKLLEIWFGRSIDCPDDNQRLVVVKTGSVDIIRRSSDGEEDEKSGDDDAEEELNWDQLELNDRKTNEVCESDSQTKVQSAGNRFKRVVRREGDLRRIPKQALQEMLAVVKCEIISGKQSEHIDAYVLSESSLFVSRNRIILKTCGSTVLLRCIQPLLYLAKKYAGFDQVLDVFYSHKNFMRPELQEKMHSSFDYEVKTLESMFAGGAAYCLGRMNRDCYYFYTLNPDETLMSANQLGPDQTLEIIMQELDPKVMSIFTKAESGSAKEATMRSGIDKIFADAIIDDYLFTPCGYSMNGLIKGAYYFTIHITPEEHCSFVSFETNYPQKNYQNLINKVLRMFNPGKFTMTLFANEQSMASEDLNSFQYQVLPVFKAKDLQFSRCKNYDMTYGHFAKAPS